MRPLSWAWATRDFLQARVPTVCLWSSHILARPSEWDQNVVIGGYTSLDHETLYTPPDSLKAFLGTDKPILAISFGSMTIPDPIRLLSTLSSAVARNEATAVVCRSWSATLEKGIDIPPHLYLADSIPHNWLLPHVDGFVHHGGAGHTAAGLRAGVPMLLVPFLLDQYFWAAKIHELGLGPSPLEIRTLTTPELATSLRNLLSERYRDRCAKMAMQVQAEGDGADVAADVIERQIALPEMNMPCSVIPALTAHWEHMESGLLLSGPAAACLASCEIVSWDDLDLQPRIDWAKRWRAASTSLGWAHILCRVTNLISIILGVFNTMVTRVFGGKSDVWSVERDSDTIKKRDPVRQARIRQSEFDLQLIKRHVDEKQAATVDDRLVRRWQALAAAKSHEQFENRNNKSVRFS